jgi:colanic acid/amylovoran biosynthesis protein
MRVFIEGYDKDNWGDVLMATTSALLAHRVRPGAEIVFPRPLPYKDDHRSAVLENIRYSIEGDTPSLWSRFRKPKGSYEFSSAAYRAHPGDAVLFCNGFIFGDNWRASWISRVATAIKRLNRRGVSVILMPQSFGPFSERRKAALARAAVSNAALVFARDEESFGYLHGLGCAGDNVVSSLDYTGVLNTHPAFACSSARQNRLVIIPNVKIKQKMGEDVEADYVRQLAEIGKLARGKHGIDVSVAMHTHRKDLKLAERVAHLSEAKVFSGDPLEIRRFIGESRFVVTSRFHGLMNALSQGVPALSIGWSHKYNELMRAYGLGGYAVDIASSKPAMEYFEYLVSEEEMLRTALLKTQVHLETSHYRELTDRLTSTFDNGGRFMRAGKAA